jgi:hypothetical protein
MKGPLLWPTRRRNVGGGHQGRQLRHLVRHRQNLMADAKDVKLQVRSMLKEEGVPEQAAPRAWTKAWREWLAGVTLPEESRWILDHQRGLRGT